MLIIDNPSVLSTNLRGNCMLNYVEHTHQTLPRWQFRQWMRSGLRIWDPKFNASEESVNLGVLFYTKKAACGSQEDLTKLIIYHKIERMHEFVWTSRNMFVCHCQNTRLRQPGRPHQAYYMQTKIQEHVLCQTKSACRSQEDLTRLTPCKCECKINSLPHDPHIRHRALWAPVECL